MPAAAPRSPVLLVEDVVKRYGDAWALRGVSFRVEAGEVLGLLGPNGAGKTSLIRMLLDLTRPDVGRLLVLGELPSLRTRERIGYLPEERGLYPKQRVSDVLTYFVGLAGISPDEARRRSEAWLERVGLGEWSRRRVKELSKGMQQKVQLGAAVLHDPSLVILDEPFSGLDPINRRIVGEVVRELQSKGAAVVISTHLMSEVEQLADSVVLLNRGAVVLQGTLDEVRSRFASESILVDASEGWSEHPCIKPLLASVEAGRGFSEATLASGVDAQVLLAALLSASIEVKSFSRSVPSLDDVFVRALGSSSLDDEQHGTDRGLGES